MALPLHEAAALMDPTTHIIGVRQDATLSTEPSTAPLSESMTPTPLTSMDTPLGADGVENKEASGKSHDGSEALGRPQTNPQSLESQFDKLQARLEYLENLERQRAQKNRSEDDDTISMTIPTPTRVRLDDSSSDDERPPRRNIVVDVTRRRVPPPGIYIDKTIDSYERQLRQLKSEKEKIRDLQAERNRLQATVDELQEKQEGLNKRLRELEQLEANATTVAEPTDGQDQTDVKDPTDDKIEVASVSSSYISRSSTDRGYLSDRPVIPELNRVEWKAFKSPKEQETEKIVFAIDVLKGEPVISFEHPNNAIWALANPRRPVESIVSTNGPATTSNVPISGQAPLAERIRINSKHILKILEKIHGERWRISRPIVMIRPYRTLAYYDESIHQYFQQLKERFGRDDTGPEDAPTSGSSAEAGTDRGGDGAEAKDGSPEDNRANAGDDQDEFTSSQTAYQHLKCLVDFMDNDIHQKLQYIKSNRCQTVTFSDIWYLFRPGMEVIDQTRRQAYRILSISSAPHVAFSPYSRWLGASKSGHSRRRRRAYERRYDDDDEYYEGEAEAAEETPVWLHCVYIDFDGKSLGPVVHDVKITNFEGEKAITALEVFPLRFAEKKSSDNKERADGPKKPELRQRLIARGKMFLDVTTPKHMHYNGLTLEKRDEIDSHVVVDFEEAFLQRNPAEDVRGITRESNWMPTLRKLIGDPPKVNFEEDACRAECCLGESIHASGDAERKRNQQHMALLMPNDDQQEPSLMIYPRLLEDIKRLENSLSDDDFLIMTYRVFGFVLRSRKWAKLDLTHLSPPETSGKTARDVGKIKDERENNSLSTKTAGNARDGSSGDANIPGVGNEATSTGEDESHTVFGQLVLPKGHKEMVKSLISQHFRDKESASKGDRDAEQIDIVRGKGKGLIILLHGAPGVGKTTTAEGVAEMFKKPLFQITCGDLGTSASEVEEALEKHFSLANKWGCILLLDEADVFLAARSKMDFQRNGLVSVFLRVLEYYAGILFLTTNRIGDFDEAFVSRIHISLYYPQLDIDSTLAIFKLNLSLINERFKLKQRDIQIEESQILDFAQAYFNDHPQEQWNGRQIRNACQTALALAEYRAQGSSHEKVVNTKATVVLTRSDLETVSNAYLGFIKYLDRVRGLDAERWAKKNLIRAMESENYGKKVNALETATGKYAQPSPQATHFAQPTAPAPQPGATAPPVGAAPPGPAQYPPPPGYPYPYGYNAQPGYTAPPGYNPQPGYAQSGYNTQPGYAQPGYNTQPGHNTQPGYNPQPGYGAPTPEPPRNAQPPPPAPAQDAYGARYQYDQMQQGPPGVSGPPQGGR